MFSCATYKDLPKYQMMSDIDYGFETKTAALSKDIKIAYYEAGSGRETIIMIHGLGSNMAAWKKNLDVLAKDFHVIALDLPGYGKSSMQPHSALMSHYSDIVMEFAEVLDLGKVSLAGHSMGGQIALLTALQYPERVNKLILAAPAGFENFHPGQRLWFKDVMTPDLVRLTKTEAIENNLATNFYKVPKDAQFMIDDRISMRTAVDFENYCLIVARSVGGMVDEPVYDKLGQIAHPTLVIFGENDNLIPNRYLNPGKTEDIAKDGSSRMQNAELHMIEKAGHFVMFEQYEEFNQQVKDFL